MIRQLSIILGALIVASIAASAQEPIRFEDVFVDSTMRIDFYHVADSDEEEITLDKIYCQGVWAGNPKGLIDPFNNGRYRVRIIDVPSNRVLYTNASTGACAEYITTTPAAQGIRKTFHESALTPFPRKPFVFVVERRDRPGLFTPVFTVVIDPHDYHIIKEPPSRKDIVVTAVNNGDPHSCVDLVILGDGYTADEVPKFRSDVKRYADLLLGFEPYRSYKNRFNITGILRPSPESGVDQPRQGIFSNTTLGATFNFLESDRYLLTEDNKEMRDVAAAVPYDALLMMVNSTRYGGGALVNTVTAFTSDGGWSEEVFLHEFGHGFAGLADEYYAGEETHNQFYPPGLEPTEPNLTALLDPEHLKWKEFVSPGVIIPTEWGQALFDSLKARQDTLGKQQERVVHTMRSVGVTDAVVNDTIAVLEKRIQAVNEELKNFIVHHPLHGKIGAFRGGGYQSTGLYRPTLNSLMHMFYPGDETYYRVNEAAIIRVIKHFTE